MASYVSSIFNFLCKFPSDCDSQNCEDGSRLGQTSCANSLKKYQVVKIVNGDKIVGEMDPCTAPCDEEESSTDTSCEEFMEETAGCSKSENEINRVDGNKSRNISRKYRGPSRIDKQLQNIIMTVRESSLRRKLGYVENRACELFKKHGFQLPNCLEKKSETNSWQKLTPKEKFLFYWATLSGQFLHENAFENFLHYIINENSFENKCLEDKNFVSQMKIMWKKMDKKDKMPFIMEAFLYEVGVGKINLEDDCNIRDKLEELYDGSSCDYIF